jgi:dolichyl-phosphate beta-glucosyltransferase
VIPAYNEAQRLPATLAAWARYLEAQPYLAEIVVVDDGSRDQTAQVVGDFAAARAGPPAVHLRRLPANQGKGAAVKLGMLTASGAHLFYVDADLNIGPQHLSPALRLLETSCDLVVGQRSLAQYAAAERSLARLLAGAAVQALRRAVVLPAIRDTQCGFKGFRRRLARAIFRRTRIRSFAFDIEVLFLARKLGAAITELPVATTYRAGSTYSVRRHLLPFLRDVLQIRLNDLRGYYRDL